MSTPFCFVDCETTSLGPDRRAWEVAIIRHDADTDPQMRVMQVDDVSLHEADPKSLEIGGFYARHCDYGKPGEDVEAGREQAVARWVEEWTRGAMLIGINPAFDAEVLAAMLRRHNLVPAWHYTVIDLKAMAAGYLYRHAHELFKVGGGSQELGDALQWPFKTEALAQACGVPLPDEKVRHTALGDAIFAETWWFRLITGGTP